jgi:hypothetical protein
LVKHSASSMDETKATRGQYTALHIAIQVVDYVLANDTSVVVAKWLPVVSLSLVPTVQILVITIWYLCICERQQQQQQQQQQRIVPVQYRKRPSNRKEFLDYRYNDRVPSQMPIYVTVYSCTHKNADETKR